jgi:hypothetical protein
MEAFTPAVAGVLGVGLAVIAERLVARGPRRTALAAIVAAGVLLAPLSTAVRVVRSGAEDSQTLGAMPAAQVASLRRYLHVHQRGTRYEVATSDTIVGGPLVVVDGEPIVPLTSWFGRPLTSAARLRALVRSGQVRHVLLAETGCAWPTAPSCARAARWAIAHGRDVSSAAGLGANRVLLELHA